MKKEETTEGINVYEYILLGASAVLIISAFLPWVKYNLVSGDIQTPMTIVSGLGTYFGYLSIACGLGGIAMFFTKRYFKVLGIIAGILSLAISLLFWFYITKVTPTMAAELQNFAGWGLYLSLITSVVFAVMFFLIRK